MARTQSLNEIVADAVRLSAGAVGSGLSQSDRTTVDLGGAVSLPETALAANEANPLSEASSAAADTQQLASLLTARAVSDQSTSTGESSGVLLDLTNALIAQTEATTTNTSAVAENSDVFTSALKGGLASSLGKSILGTLGSGLGLSPIISLVGKLFGGGGDEQTNQTLAVYTPASSIQYSGFIGGQSTPSSQTTASSIAATAGAAGSVVQNTPVTISVTAMDSRSFLDHSDEIAQAVRRALLESHSLNDVILES